MNNTINKILACMLVITLTCTNLILLGTYATNSYAASSELEQQENLIQDVVQFDAYFKDESNNNSKIHTKTVDVNTQDLKICVSLAVLQGYLKEAEINMQGASFILEDVSANYEEIQKIENNIITLNEIPNEQEIIFEIPVKIDKSDIINVNNFYKENKIEITGTVVTGKTGITGKEKNTKIEGTIIVELNIYGDATPILNKGATTYSEYGTQTEKGVILQTLVQTGLKDNNLPIETTILELDVPKLNEVKPDVINVRANSLMATKAEKDGNSFNDGNYKYYQDEDKIRITVMNSTNEKEEASWSKTGLDEYVITYVYKNQTISDIKEMALKADLQITTYAYNKEDAEKPQSVKALDERTTILERVAGNIVNFEIESTESISKGYMYHKPENETEYQVTWIANLGYTDIIDFLEFRTEGDILENNSEGANVSGATYYKSTIISKDSFNNILVNEKTTGKAYIEILDGNTKARIARIDETTQANEENNIVINYGEGIDNVYIISSNPVKSGELKIVHNKAVKIPQKYESQVQNFGKLKTKLNGAVVNSNIQIDIMELDKEILLENSQTKLNATIDKTNLSTITTNNVKMQITLKNNNISEDLYKNPIIEVVLPSYVKEMKVNNIGLINGDGFQEPQVISAGTNQNGRLALVLGMQGLQENYNENKTYEGTIIEIEADITMDTLTPSIEDKIQIYVTNESAVTYDNENEGKAYKEIAVKFESIPGMITVNEIANYNEKENVKTINSEEQLGKIKINSASKNANVKLTVINNSENACNDVSILGRLPFAGNKDFAENELGSNMTLKLVSGITAVSGISAENVKIYYSEEAEATKESASWVESVQDLSNIKSYLIILENYEMIHGSRIDFEYNVEIPANLKHDQTAYTMYKVYFNKEEKTSGKIGLSTMSGPELNINLKSSAENGSMVSEGEKITYTIEVSNTGKVEANNVKVSGIVPEGTIYVTNTTIGTEMETFSPIAYEGHPEVKVYEEIINSIQPGEVKTLTYMVNVKKLKNEEQQKEISSTATVEIPDLEDVYTTNTIKNTIKKGFINIQFDESELTKKVKENAINRICLNIVNANNETKTNVKAIYKIPDGVEYQGAEADFNGSVSEDRLVYNQNENTLTYNIGTLNANEYTSLDIIVKVSSLEENETEKEIVNLLEVTCDQKEEVIQSSQLKFIVQKAKIEISQTSDVAQGNIDVGDIINYYIEVKNVGKIEATNVKIIDYIPEGLKYLSTNYTINGYTQQQKVGSDTAQVVLDIGEGETAYIKIEVVAEELKDGQKTKEVTNIVKASANNLNEIEANPITHIVNSKVNIQNGQNNSNNSGNGNNNNNNNSLFKITGAVWQDDNENGNREDNEILLKEIKVWLLDAKTSNKVSETTTDSKGKYEFSNLQAGRYMVAFIYNEQEYMVTTYQIESANESRNSDAIEHTIVVDEQELTTAVTNNINLTSSNMYNIDLGLILRNRFDLSLNKEINKITVKTTKDTKNYSYDDNEKLAKIDIAPKRIDGANVVIEYKITVKNNGNISGFASKIVDYLPKELKFSSELNSQWYEAEDGYIYSTAFADNEIKPGETKEIKLVLTKTMTGENTGMVHNTAEIYEAYNEFGVQDVNSTPSNKVQSENDLSYADVLLTVNTGEPAMYITLTIAMLILVAIGAYFINKKVLKY